MIKFLIYLGPAIPVLLFVKSLFFRRSTVVKSAASAFNKQIGYLDFGLVALAALVLIYTPVHLLLVR